MLSCRDSTYSLSSSTSQSALFTSEIILAVGFTSDQLGWRWVFFISSLIILLITVLGSFGFKEPSTYKAKPRLSDFDLPGASLLMVAVAPLIIGVQFIRNESANISTILIVVSVLLFSGVLIFGAIDGPGADEDIPNYRLGEGDVKLDTIEVHSLSHPVGVEVRNVGETPVDVMIVDRDQVVPYSDRGIIDWDLVITDSTMDENFRLLSLAEGELLQTEVEIESLFDSYLVLLRVSESADGIAEVRITMDYVDDELMWSALLASWPSFIIFGLVVEGYFNRSKQIVSDDITDVNS